MAVKGFNKFNFQARFIDGVSILFISMIGGWLFFLLSWLASKYEWLDWLPQMLPNSLSTYDFWTSIPVAFGLGVGGVLIAVISAIFFNDDDYFDEPLQMFGGMFVGLLITVCIFYFELIKVSTFETIGQGATLIILIMYCLLRRN